MQPRPFDHRQTTRNGIAARGFVNERRDRPHMPTIWFFPRHQPPNGPFMPINLTRALFLTACLAIVAHAAQAQSSNTAADEARIKESRRLQTLALAKNDLDTVVKFWDPAITIRRALGHPVDGAQAARKLLEPAAHQNPATAIVYQREATSVTVSAHWPLAYEEGKWTGHVGSIDSKPILGGKYAAQWVKRDGIWLIRSEVFVAIDCADAGCKAPALP